jgi:hypothetical protein
MDCRVPAVAVQLVAQSTNNWTAPVAAQAIFLDSEKLTSQGWDFSRFVKEACFSACSNPGSWRDGAATVVDRAIPITKNTTRTQKQKRQR